MRVWIFNHYASPPTNPGGTRHYNFAIELKKRGHDVLIIAANYNHFSQKYTLGIDKNNPIDNSHEVPFLWLNVPAYKGNGLKRFWNMLMFAYAIVKNKYLNTCLQPDVIIGSSPHLFSALGAELLAKRLKVPFILEIRDLWPESLVDLGRINKRHPVIIMLKAVEKYLYKNAKKILTLLPSSTEYLQKYGVKSEDIIWLPNYVDISKIPKASFANNQKFTVMYAGAHGLANDLDSLIEAGMMLEARGLADKIKLCLIGDGPEKQRLQTMVKENKLTMIEFLDAVPKSEIYQTLEQADAYLMLLKDSPVFRWGISPNKLFDYLAMAKPVIFGVNTPFNPIDQYTAGISVSPSDPKALANAIYQLSNCTKQELKAMGERGKKFVAEQHDILLLTNRLEEAMNSLK